MVFKIIPQSRYFNIRLLKQKELIINYLETGWLIYYFFSTVIGFLIMTNGKSVSNYIWKDISQNQNS
jgi:hypothetical protein